MKKKFMRIFLCLLVLGLSLSITVQADMGPKPSVHITFKNAPGVPYYATLLSSQSTNGPNSAYDGTNAWNPGEIWQAFVDYKDMDGYYFLQEFWDCTDADGFAWTYMAPDTFKILCYFPKTDTYAVSDIHTRYAFDTYYELDLANWQSGEILPANKDYAFVKEAIFLVVRVVLTILVELGVAVLFGCDGKSFRKIIIPTNIATQLFLNVALNYNAYRALILNHWGTNANHNRLFFMLEGAVFIIEAAIYHFRFPERPDRKEVRITGYAFWANLCSYAVGWVLAGALPALF